MAFKVLTGNQSGKNFFQISSRVCGSDAQEDFLHGSVRRLKPSKSSTNLWVWPFDSSLAEVFQCHNFEPEVKFILQI